MPKKMKTKEDNIEVNNINRRQIRRLKLKKTRKVTLSLIARKIYLRFLSRKKLFVFACCHDVGQLYVTCMYVLPQKIFLAFFLQSKLEKRKLFTDFG